MTVAEICEKVASGVVHFQFELHGERVGSGSGFLLNGQAITNHHVYKDSIRFDTRIRYLQSGAYRDVSFPPGSLSRCLKAGSEESSYDFAILEIPQLKNVGLHNFEAGNWHDFKIGTSILILGFPFDIDRLTFHAGIISAKLQSGVAIVFQIDASVTPSNSGGPLIEADTGKLIGIVTRRHTGFTDEFEQLVRNIDAGIAELTQPRRGSAIMMGFDPFHAFAVILQQMRVFTAEVCRSANVGIGYAFSLNGIANHIGI
jgi:S1-C subfamily serine protease